MLACSTELQHYIDQKVRSGEFASPDAFAVKAIQLYREMESRHQQLRADLQRSIDQADRGETEPLDMDAIKAEARRRYDSQRGTDACLS